MKIDFFRDLKNNFRNNNETRDFIKDLLNCLDDYETNENLGLLEQIQQKNKVSTISQNKMLKMQDKILKQYATKTSNNIYFISSKFETDSAYTIFKYQGNKETTLQVHKKQIPIDAKVNSVLIKENGKYILDNQGTKYVKSKVHEMANKILKEQNQNLNKFRKEGHLYMVEEDINNRIYLLDLSDKSNYVIEEVDFPKDLINKATEGSVFKYENGQYVFHSSDGYEMLY